MRMIALGRMIYGLVLLAAGLTIFNLLGKDISPEISGLIDRWHIQNHLYYVHWFRQEVARVKPSVLVLLTVVDLFYAALAFIETGGLILGKRWAYWLVIADTASFIPIEIYQLCKQFGWINFILLLYYLATVIYLLLEIVRVPRQRLNHHS